MEKWVSEYDLLMFDFDGLLADTEHIHYRAYCKMCNNRGITINWSFAKYVLYIFLNCVFY